MPTILRPRASKRERIGPTSPRWTPSGLIKTSVRSMPVTIAKRHQESQPPDGAPGAYRRVTTPPAGLRHRAAAVVPSPPAGLVAASIGARDASAGTARGGIRRGHDGRQVGLPR